MIGTALLEGHGCRTRPTI